MVVRVRTLRSWLLGLYIAAQVIGLVPLIYEHTLNIYQRAAHSGPCSTFERHNPTWLRPPTRPNRFPRRCCAIHSLAGPLPPAVSLVLEECATSRVSPAELVVLVSWHSARLDRPPKALPLV